MVFSSFQEPHNMDMMHSTQKLMVDLETQEVSKLIIALEALIHIRLIDITLFHHVSTNCFKILNLHYAPKSPHAKLTQGHMQWLRSQQNCNH